MGIKNFSKVFKPEIITFKDIKNKKLAVDAYLLLYQSALGSSSVNLLTGPDGEPTMYISVIIGKCLNFIKNNNKCCWVFDYHEKDYVSPDKQNELNIRKEKRKKASEKLNKLKEMDKKYKELFSSDNESDNDEEQHNISVKDTKDHQKKINQKEKEIFSLDEKMINNCKFILESFNISYTTSPKNIEAEAICAKLTESNICDITWSCDTDSVLYGSKVIIREIKSKGKKVLQKYTLSDILNNNKISISDLRKIGVILGSDHAPKTPKIGPGTVLKKYKDVELTSEQLTASKIFSKNINIENLKYAGYVEDITAIEKEKKIIKLIDWLVNVKGFNRSKITNRIKKVMG